MTVLHLFGVFWSVVVETAWIWGPSLVLGVLIGCAACGCDCAPPARKTVERDVNGVEMHRP